MPPINTSELFGSVHHGGLEPQQLVAPFLPLGAFAPAPVAACGTPSTSPETCTIPAEELCQLSLHLTTFNVLSLGKPGEDREGQAVGEGLAYQPARAALLADQLHRQDVHVAFLQETRADSGQSSAGRYIRFASGATKGQFGTEIWFQRDHVVLSGSPTGSCVQFTKESFTVLAADPRRLLVRFQQGSFSVLFVAVHGPHRATEQCIIESWWQETARLIRHYCRQSLVVMGGDCNASVGSITSRHVGGVAAEDEDTAGESLHGLLRAFDLCLPATMPHCHRGTSFTYVQKHGGQLCRPDFVAVPLEWMCGRTVSFCAPDIQAAHTGPDHVAASVQLTAAYYGAPAGPRLVKRAIRAADVSAPENREAIQAAFRSAPEVGWDVSVHAHAAMLADHMQGALQQISSGPGRKPHHAYLSQATWDLQRQVSGTRRELHRLTHIMRVNDLAVGFKAWAMGVPLSVVVASGRSWQRQAQRASRELHAALKQSCTRLKKACRTDRDKFAADLAHTLATAPTKAAYAAYHQLLAHKRKKAFRLEPLPRVLDADGEVCPDPKASQTRWRDHFAALEAGRSSTFHDLALEASRATHTRGSPHPPTISEVPSLPALRRVLAATKTGKAAGLDSIPPELNRHYAHESAVMLHPLLLKILWSGVEPAGFKGGQAVVLYKGRGDTAECASYRSILLMGTWAKAFHQSVRPGIRRVFEAAAPSLQIGGKKGCSTIYGSHIVRTLARRASLAGTSCYTLFADISAAFYTALLQFVAQVGHNATPSSLAHALEGLNLPSEAISEMNVLLREPSALSAVGASEWLEHLAAAIGSDNWFLMARDTIPVRTGRGTRPGSSWADVLFALLMPRIFLKRDAILRQLGHDTASHTLPWDGNRSLDPCDLSEGTLEVAEITWADDVAIPRQCASAADVAQGLRADTTALTEAFYAYGFTLSYGEHKTAAIVSLRGAGSREAKQHLFGPRGLGGHLPILLEHLPAMRLPLPAKYKHLGTYQAPCGSMIHEIRYRAAQARGAYNEARRKIYKPKAIPLAKKAVYLSAMVLPKLLHGAGTWPPLTKREGKALDGVVWMLYRGVLGVPRDEDQRISAATCLAILRLPDPRTLLRGSRLSYLGQLLRGGPAEVWAAVRADQPYAEMLRADLRWLYAWCWRTVDLPSPDGHWQEWSHFIQTKPGRYKGLCKRAKALAVIQFAVIAALDGLHKALCQISGTSRGVESQHEPRHTEACLPCRRSYPSRTSWAGHAARCHGYRSRAFLLPEDRVCRCCGKLFASIGRLRRHLAAAPRCLTGWGTFRPRKDAASAPVHDLAAPCEWDGEVVPAPGFDFSGGVNGALLQELTALEGGDETAVWEAIVGCIEPLCTLRSTVEAWSSAEPCTEWRREVAQNMLLLLDPDLIADTRQPQRVRSPDCFTCPDWVPLQGIALALSGAVYVLDLEAPPPHVVSPREPTSLTVRDAQAYSAWLEQACAKCAVCTTLAADQPVRLHCPRLQAALGPAAEWLTACGFSFDDRGLFSAA